jgi:hypothetical protein
VTLYGNARAPTVDRDPPLQGERPRAAGCRVGRAAKVGAAAGGPG